MLQIMELHNMQFSPFFINHDDDTDDSAENGSELW
jgi:hypothetical protein